MSESPPTIDQVRRAARQLYNGHWSDQCQILISDRPNLVRHEDGDNSGTWIDASIFVPDVDALEVKP